MKLRIPGIRRGDERRSSGEAARVEALVDGLDPLTAIEALRAANQIERSAEVERRLVRARHEAFRELDPPASSPDPLDAADPPLELELDGGLPVIDGKQLDATVVSTAIRRHGSLLVRGLIGPERAATLVAGIDAAFDARDAHAGGAGGAQTLPWFERFEPAAEYDFGKPQWNRLKRGGGSVWAADSPRVLFELLEAFEEAGLPQVITEYLGERPALSMHKSVLRRVTPDTGTDWHQDGAFLGEGIRSLNVWLALTPCGRDAPGLDVVPKRLERIVETGTEGAIFPWAVAPDKVEEVLAGEPPARPLFEPGDALLFDHMNLHRTAAEPDMTGVRYATETWCFAPSAYPEEQAPLVL